MWEDRVHPFFLAGFQPHGHHEAWDQFRDCCSHYMGSNQTAGFGVEDGFDQALITPALRLDFRYSA